MGNGGNVITMGKSKELGETPAPVRLGQPPRLCDERLASNLPQTLLFSRKSRDLCRHSASGEEENGDTANY